MANTPVTAQITLDPGEYVLTIEGILGDTWTLQPITVEEQAAGTVYTDAVFDSASSSVTSSSLMTAVSSTLDTGSSVVSGTSSQTMVGSVSDLGVSVTTGDGVKTVTASVQDTAVLVAAGAGAVTVPSLVFDTSLGLDSASALKDAACAVFDLLTSVSSSQSMIETPGNYVYSVLEPLWVSDSVVSVVEFAGAEIVTASGQDSAAQFVDVRFSAMDLLTEQDSALGSIVNTNSAQDTLSILTTVDTVRTSVVSQTDTAIGVDSSTTLKEVASSVFDSTVWVDSEASGFLYIYSIQDVAVSGDFGTQILENRSSVTDVLSWLDGSWSVAFLDGIVFDHSNYFDYVDAGEAKRYQATFDAPPPTPVGIMAVLLDPQAPLRPAVRATATLLTKSPTAPAGRAAKEEEP